VAGRLRGETQGVLFHVGGAGVDPGSIQAMMRSMHVL